MVVQHYMWVFDADGLGLYGNDRIAATAAEICKKLDELATKGWRIVGQSVLANVETNESSASHSAEEPIETRFRLVYTFVRETDDSV